jgi:hypothetical protein
MSGLRDSGVLSLYNTFVRSGVEGKWLAEWGFEYLPSLQMSRYPSVWLICRINILETLEALRV